MQAAQIQKVSAQLELSKPPPQIVGDNRQSQLPPLNHSFRFRFAERNRSFKFSGRIQNANRSRPEASARFCAGNCLIFQKFQHF